MQLFGDFKRRFCLRSITLYCLMINGGLLLSACDVLEPPPAKTPVDVCKRVTTTLLGYNLPEKVGVSEQEIHGERIVVHLSFKHPVNNAEVKPVCVFGFDRYNEEGKRQLYRKVPTRMAIDGNQISEEKLLDAIAANDFDL